MNISKQIVFILMLLIFNFAQASGDIYHCQPKDPNNPYSSYEYTLKIGGIPQLLLEDGKWLDCYYLQGDVRVSCPGSNVNYKYGEGTHVVLQTTYKCEIVN